MVTTLGTFRNNHSRSFYFLIFMLSFVAFTFMGNAKYDSIISIRATCVKIEPLSVCSTMILYYILRSQRPFSVPIL